MMLKSFQIAPGMLAVSLLVVGCTAGDSLPEVGGEEVESRVTEERLGALLAEYVQPRDWSEGAVKVQAQFLDARGVSAESALEALEVWAPRRGLEVGDCQVGLSAQGRQAAEPQSLHLLDVGPISVESSRDALALPPRRLPDLMSAFYGVVYGSEWSWEAQPSPVGYIPGGSYRFWAPGSAEAGGFDVELRAPAPITLFAANGEELVDDELVLREGEELELVWDSGGDGDRGEVFVDLFTGYGPDQTRLQCRVGDEGAFTVPASLLRELAAVERGVDLELRRVNRQGVEIEGLESAQFYFVTTDRLEVYFR